MIKKTFHHQNLLIKNKSNVALQYIKNVITNLHSFQT